MKVFKLLGILWIVFTLIHLYLGNNVVPMIIVGFACFVTILFNAEYDTL